MLRPLRCETSPASGATSSMPLGDALLWLHFWRGLVPPLAFTAVAATQLDAAFTRSLPRGSRTAAGVGLLLCIADSVRSWFREERGPDKNVTFEEGSISLGAAACRFQLHWTSASMRGWRPAMEDTHVATVSRSAGSELALFGVFDGHGGSEVSSIAQVLFPRLFAARHLSDSFKKACDTGPVLKEIVDQVDSTLLGGPLGIGRFLSLQWLHPFSSTGSTSCIAVIDAANGKITVANSGDSRAILCRNGQPFSLSEDHKPENPEERARIWKAGGRLVSAGPCYRIDGGLNLSRALGDFSYKSNFLLPASEQKVVATADIVTADWKPLLGDDFLVLACDGLFERMTRDDVIHHVKRRLAQGMPPQDVLKDLLHACCARSPMEAGQDNETAILIQWTVDSA